MAKMEFYRSVLKVKDVHELEKLFLSTLVETNCTYSFFVDWNKVTTNRDSFRNELALLSSLRGVARPRQHLRRLIAKYPEVVKVLPLLLAERSSVLKVLHALTPEYQYMIYDFGRKKYTSLEIDRIVDFCDRTGLLPILYSLESPLDYATGVEVGLDTNARKNRSGHFMEDAVTAVLTNIAATNQGILHVRQKQFSTLRSQYSMPVPAGLEDNKFDDVLIVNRSGTNIEVNFYGGTGSKPTETVNSYINRKQELESIGWRFIWITDGDGWNKMTNQLRKGLDNLDYVLNLHMLQQGMLERIILEDG